MEDFICSQNNSFISCNFSSSLTSVDRAIDTIKNFLHSLQVSLNQFELLFVLREALNNAVIHGNKNDIALKVDCTLRLDRDILTITVKPCLQKLMQPKA